MERLGLGISCVSAGSAELVEFVLAKADNAGRVAEAPRTVIDDLLSMLDAVGNSEETTMRASGLDEPEPGSITIAVRGRVRSRRAGTGNASLLQQSFPFLHFTHLLTSLTHQVEWADWLVESLSDLHSS